MIKSASNFTLISYLILNLFEIMAFKKESWINNKRQYKRHTRNPRIHCHAARAVDGDFDQSLHSFLLNSNFIIYSLLLQLWTWPISRHPGSSTYIFSSNVNTHVTLAHPLNTIDEFTIVEHIEV